MKFRSTKIAAAGILFSAIGLIAVDLVCGLEFWLISKQWFEHQLGYQPVAVYGSGGFKGYSDFDTVTFYYRRKGEGKIFVSVDGKTGVPIEQLSMDFARSHFPEPGERFDASEELYFTDNASSVFFSESRLISVKIRDVSQRFKIGPTKDGPFISLPIDRETMYKLWGRPDRWERDYIEGI